MSNNKKYNFIFDLLAKAKEKEGLDVVRLRNELREKIGTGDETFGKFRELMESFQEIIPQETQRYNAAIKALSATSGISRQDVLESMGNQLEELRILEKGVLASVTGFYDELKAMESRADEIESEIAKLREKLADFEKQEREILAGKEAREKDMKVVEEGVRKVFSDVGAEISDFRKKIEEFTGEKVSSQPVTIPDSTESHKSEDERDGIEAEESISPKETKWTKKCPLCGGLMNFHTSESMWKCYTCGNEEIVKDDADVSNEDATVKDSSAAPEPAASLEPAVAAEPAAASEDELTPVASEPVAVSSKLSSPVKRPPRKKTCPACRKQMILREEDNTWTCTSCNYQRREF